MSKSSENASPGPGKYGTAKTSSDVVHGADALMEINAELIQECLHAVVQAGDAMLVGTSRDGGTLVIQMFSGDASDKLYASTAEELTLTLEGIREAASTSK